MGPVGVMHCGKGNASFVSLNGSHHHVGRVDGVHKVGREGRVLFAFVHWLVVDALGNAHLLNDCLNHTLARNGFVGLDTG